VIFYVPAAEGRDWLDSEHIDLQLSVSSPLLVLGQHTILVLLQSGYDYRYLLVIIAG
jgi:hypothetical protein